LLIYLPLIYCFAQSNQNIQIAIRDSITHNKADSIKENDILHLAKKNDLKATDTIIVTAGKKWRLLETPQSYSIITSEDWKGTNINIADLIAEQTGVQTRRYGGTGSFQSVSIRGIEGDKVLVLLDGIPLNSIMGEVFDLSLIDLNRLEEIELYKGITPAQFGGNSIGGVINLKSKSNLKTNTFNSFASIGAYGYKKIGIENLNFIYEKLKIFSSLTYIESKNNWPYLDRNNTPYNTTDDKIKELENHGYNFFEVRLHPSFYLKDNRIIYSAISYTNSDVGIPAVEGLENKTAKHGKKLILLNFRIPKNISAKENLVNFTPEFGFANLKDNIFWTSLDQSMGTNHGTISILPNSYGETNSDLYILSFSGITDLNFKKDLSAQASILAKHSQIKTWSNVVGFPQGDWPGNSQEISISSQIRYSLVLNLATTGICAGASIKGIRSATEGGENKVIEITVPKQDTFEFPWSVNGGINYTFKDKITAFINAARYSKIPDLREKYGQNGLILPNPALMQETGIAIEGGVKVSDKKYYAEAVLFRNQTKNEIVMLSDGIMIKPVNLASALTYGLEFLFSIQPANLMKLETRNTFQNSINCAHLYNYYGKKMPNQPMVSSVNIISFFLPYNITAKYWLDFKSPFFRDFANTLRVPEDEDLVGSFFHNALLCWNINKKFEISFSVRNFTNTSLRYEELIKSYESGYSWILYPKNEWCITVKYSF